MQNNLRKTEKVKFLAQIKEVGEKNRINKKYFTLPLRNT